MYLLEVDNLTVSIDGKVILENFNLNIDQGEIHVLFGANGSGKTTLVKALLGIGGFKVESGRIIFKGQDITHMSPDKRVRLGLGCLFQNPPEVRGIRFNKLLGILIKQKHPDFTKAEVDARIQEIFKSLNFDEEFLTRDVNKGFSGGEKKRAELIQLLAMEPDLILFDEPDSGVDVENVELMGKVIKSVLQQDRIPRYQKRSGLIITHTAYILQYIGRITKAHVLVKGQIVCEGNPERIQKIIEEKGFDGCISCLNKDAQNGDVCIFE